MPSSLHTHRQFSSPFIYLLLLLPVSQDFWGICGCLHDCLVCFINTALGFYQSIARKNRQTTATLNIATVNVCGKRLKPHLATELVPGDSLCLNPETYCLWCTDYHRKRCACWRSIITGESKPVGKLLTNYPTLKRKFTKRGYRFAEPVLRRHCHRCGNCTGEMSQIGMIPN